ncbi:DNA cytosine methyltransferase, partial [Acinetobacter baumannii]
RGHPQDPVPPGPGVRALTTEERARIQTFPRGWKWVGAKTEVEQMIGNAVPPELARFVGEALRDYLEERLPCLPPSFAKENFREHAGVRGLG